MNDFARRLPWRLAALAGLIVGGISLAGGIDIWVCLTRVGAALFVFGLLGIGLRSLLTEGKDDTPREPALPAATKPSGETTLSEEDH